MRWLALLAGSAVVALAGPAVAQDFGPEFEATGSFGLRYQVEAEDPSEADDMHRLRLRAAVGAVFRAAEWLQFSARIRAGEVSEPRDSHVELGSRLELLEVAIDRAYALAELAVGLELLAGVFEHPAEASRAIWDPDLAATGAAARYARRLEAAPIEIRPVGFAYLLRSDLDAAAAGVYGGQLAATLAMDSMDLTVSGSAYLFERVDALAGVSQENSLDSDGGLAEDFSLLEGRGSIRLHVVHWLPIEVRGSVVYNAEADDDNLGVTLGVQLGRSEWPGDWALGYRFRRIEQDAVLAGLASDDYRLATDYRGHDVEIGYQIADAVRVAGSLYLFERRGAGEPIQVRTRLDVSIEL